MDLMFSLPCSTKLCTGALFIHQTGPRSSHPLTKNFRINWHHQSKTQQTDNFLPLSMMQIISNMGKSKVRSLLCLLPLVLTPKLGCSVECLTSSPLVPRGFGRNILTKINAVVCSNWGGKWRIVNDGQIIGVCCSSPSCLWSGDRKERGVRKVEGGGAYSAVETIWSRDTLPLLPFLLL